ncbi:MAG TPA: hypothetical protein VHX37_14130 [Acidobacteriaceae bacterium]|jgi:hypothetical protein|nr:hypothetical protein [Acidobacteriaceae bacterium]
MRKNHYNQTMRAILPLRQAAVGAVVLSLALFCVRLSAQLTTTTVQGTIYRADGSAASGTLLVSWPAFTTPANQAVAAGNVSTAIGSDGFVSLNLTANAGATPAGSYYTAVYHLNDGTVNTEYWVVPAGGTASVASIRAQLQPATVAVQSASQTYVDNAITTLAGASLPLAGGVMTGPLTLSSDPVSANQAATRHYADQLASSNLPLSGGTMTGALNGTGANFSGTVAAGNAILSAGPYIDVRAYGAKCDGATDDAAALQSALNAWMAGGTLISPEGAVCVFKSPLVVDFTPGNASWLTNKLIDFRGGYWLGEMPSPGLTDFKIEETGPGQVQVQNIKLTNGSIQDGGGTNAAAMVVDFNGGGGALHFLAHIETDRFTAVANGRTIGIHLQSVFQSHFYSTTAQNDAAVSSAMVGAWDWYIQKEAPGDQATGDISLTNCEGIQGDVGVYDNSGGDNKVIGGTYWGEYEQGMYAGGVRGEVIREAHFENTWNGNSSGTIRPDIECDGSCTVDSDFDDSAGGTAGQRNFFAKLYAGGVGSESFMSAATMDGGPSFQQAWVQTTAGWQSAESGHVTLRGISAAQIADGNGNNCSAAGYAPGFCSNLTIQGTDGSTVARAGQFDTLAASTLAAQTMVSGGAGTPGFSNGVLTCQPGTYLDICLNAAATIAGTNESGSGSAITVQLQSAIYTFSSGATMPYPLFNGLTLRGVPPRVASDAVFTENEGIKPNGGTWINCGNHACFAATGTLPYGYRNINFFDLGFMNWSSYIAQFGTSSTQGLSNGKFIDLYGAGNSTPGSSDKGFIFYTPANLQIDYLFVTNVNQVLAFIANGTYNSYHFGNSSVNNLQAWLYPKGTAYGNCSEAGVSFQAGGTQSLNLITGSFWSILGGGNDASSCGPPVELVGTSAGAGVHDNTITGLDLENQPGTTAINLTYAFRNTINLMYSPQGYAGVVQNAGTYSNSIAAEGMPYSDTSGAIYLGVLNPATRTLDGCISYVFSGMATYGSCSTPGQLTGWWAANGLSAGTGAAHAGGVTATNGLWIGTNISGSVANFDADNLRHLIGPTPTASAGTVTGTNEGGEVTGLSGVTSVTITFNPAWNTWAACPSLNTSTGTAAYPSAMNGGRSVTVTFASSFTGTLYYSCNGN